MIQLVSFVVVLILAGYGLRRAGVVSETTGKELNQAILFLFLPALIFHALHGANLQGGDAAMPLVAWLVMGLSFAVGWAVSRLAGQRGAMAASMVLAIALSNTTYFGYPIVRAMFGERALTLAILFDLLGATIAANFFGSLVASAAHGQGPDWRGALLKVLKLPSVAALVLGLALRDVTFPSAMDGLIQQLGALAVPCTMLAFGMSLRFSEIRERWPLVAVAAVARLVVIPALALGACVALRLPLEMRQAAVMEAAMPTMFLTLNLAMHFDLDDTFVRNMLVVSSLASMLTLPLWHALLLR